MQSLAKQLHLLYLIQKDPVMFRDTKTLLGVYGFRNNAEAALKSYKSVYHSDGLFLDSVEVSTDWFSDPAYYIND